MEFQERHEEREASSRRADCDAWLRSYPYVEADDIPINKEISIWQIRFLKWMDVLGEEDVRIISPQRIARRRASKLGQLIRETGERTRVKIFFDGGWVLW